MAQNRATAQKVLRSALANKRVGDKVHAALAGMHMPAAIVATATSTTTDFAALMVGDHVISIPAVAGDVSFETVVAAGTKPSAAVIGDLYLVLRASALDSDIGPVKGTELKS